MSNLAEEFMSLFFMFIGLTFFVFMIWLVTALQHRDDERDLQRDREFGLREPRSIRYRARRPHTDK